MNMTIQSSAFASCHAIPVRFTGEGEDWSPPLSWTCVPQAAMQLALICDDPDAPTAEPWVHWLIYQISPDVRSLPEHLPRDQELLAPIKARQGCNSWPKGKNLGYRGPLPPNGHGIHHYHFKLYALDVVLDLPAGIDKPRLIEAMEDHVLTTAEVVGTYERK